MQHPPGRLVRSQAFTCTDYANFSLDIQNLWAFRNGVQSDPPTNLRVTVLADTPGGFLEQLMVSEVVGTQIGRVLGVTSVSGRAPATLNIRTAAQRINIQAQAGGLGPATMQVPGTFSGTLEVWADWAERASPNEQFANWQQALTFPRPVVDTSEVRLACFTNTRPDGAVLIVAAPIGAIPYTCRVYGRGFKRSPNTGNVIEYFQLAGGSFVVGPTGDPAVRWIPSTGTPGDTKPALQYLVTAQLNAPGSITPGTNAIQVSYAE